MKYRFIGRNTAMNKTYRAEGNTFKDLFYTLVDNEVMHWDALDSYLADEYGVNNDDYDWENEPQEAQEKWEKDYYSAIEKMQDFEWIDVMARANGNAYYQEIYNNETNERIA